LGAGGEDVAEGGAEAGAGVGFSPEEWGLPEEFPADMGPGPDTEETRDTAGEEPGGKPPAAGPSDGEIAVSEDEFPAESPGEEDFQLDEFVLPEMEEPSVPEDQEGPPEVPGAAAFSPPAGDEEGGPAVPAAEEGLALSNEEFAALQSALASLPRKLKMAVEELVAERQLAGQPLRSLVDLLVEGASPSSIAAQVFRITGQKIRLPPGFEKRTGLAFEAERRTFAYAFRENILPILRVFVLGGLLLSVLAYAGYLFVYRPIHAWSLYRSGYALLEQGDYPPANRDFERATGVQPMRGWYLRYADGFIGQRQYGLAEEKYEQLLKRYPGDREGRLAYARLETTHLANFEKAEEQLNLLLKKDFRDYNALLLRGDTYLEWAAEEEKYYEKARFDYAQAMDFHGERNDVLFRMLRYFIRTDNLEEARKLKRGLESQPRLKVDPQVYAELGGYLLDRSSPQGHPKALGEVQATLFRALKVNPDVPEAHYHLARFYRRVADPGEEEKALKKAIDGLDDPGAPGNRQRIMLIDSHDRLGRLYWTRRQYLDAEQEYQTAKEMIETGQKSGGLGRNPVFGEVYHNLADIYYYVDRNGETALGLYEKAGENGYRSAAMDYKMGYVEYTGGRFDAALLQFAKAAEDLLDNPNVLYALANTLYHRGDYYSAEGYYLHLLRVLEARRGRFRTLQPEVDPEHRALVANTMRVYNNLGVTLSRLSERSGDRRKYSQSLAHLTYASEYFDVLHRDPDTLARGDTKNLAFLNQRGLLYPPSGFELQLYNLIPLDPDARELQE
jgi:tetratricopeptide (TPR) repeat protein